MADSSCEYSTMLLDPSNPSNTGRKCFAFGILNTGNSLVDYTPCGVGEGEHERCKRWEIRKRQDNESGRSDSTPKVITRVHSVKLRRVYYSKASF